MVSTCYKWTPIILTQPSPTRMSLPYAYGLGTILWLDWQRFYRGEKTPVQHRVHVGRWFTNNLVARLTGTLPHVGGRRLSVGIDERGGLLTRH